MADYGIILYCLFGITKDIKDIAYESIHTKEQLEANVVQEFKDKEAYKNEQYKKLINNIVGFYGKNLF